MMTSAVATLFALTALTAAPPDAAAPAANARPNIIWILLDACRADHLSCYGYERETSPNLDALAAGGVLFEQHCAQSNMTRWSVPSFLTGQYFPVCSFSPIDWRAETRVRPPDEQYLSETLAAAGYTTSLITTHPGISPRSKLRDAFERYHWVKPAGDMHYGDFEKVYAEALQPELEALKDGPFFLYVHTLDTHTPHYVYPGHDQWMDRTKSQPMVEDPEGGTRTPVSVRTEEGREYYRGAYDGSVHYADAQVGAVLAELERLGLRENTLVIINADHGDLIGEDGRSMGHPYGSTASELIHVPLIMAGPGVPAGRRVGQLTENVDIVPSVIDILGIDSRARYDGKSFKPLITAKDAPDPHRYALFKSAMAGQGEDTLTILALHDANYTYEWNPMDGRRRLWAPPGPITARQDVFKTEKAAADTRQDYVGKELLYRWNRYEALPQTAPRYPFFLPIRQYVLEGGEFTPDTYTKTNHHRDAMWSMKGLDLCAAFTEDAPPITLSFKVPNGRYGVEAQMRLGAHMTGKSSALRVKLGDAPDFTRIAGDAVDPAAMIAGSGYELAYYPLGTLDISEGVLRITLEDNDAADDYSSFCRGFRLTPQNGGAEPEQDEIEETLRGLGYL